MNIMQTDGSVHTSGCQELIWLRETLSRSFSISLPPTPDRLKYVSTQNHSGGGGEEWIRTIQRQIRGSSLLIVLGEVCSVWPFRVQHLVERQRCKGWTETHSDAAILG